MGKSVILIGDKEFDLNAVRAMAFAGKTGVRDYGKKQFDVLFGEGYVSFQADYNGLIMHEYSPEALKELPYDEPQFILMQYSTQGLLEKMIGAKDFPRSVLVDCDGLGLGLERFIEKARLLNSGEK